MIILIWNYNIIARKSLPLSLFKYWYRIWEISLWFLVKKEFLNIKLILLLIACLSILPLQGPKCPPSSLSPLSGVICGPTSDCGKVPLNWQFAVLKHFSILHVYFPLEKVFPFYVVKLFFPATFSIGPWKHFKSQQGAWKCSVFPFFSHPVIVLLAAAMATDCQQL